MTLFMGSLKFAIKLIHTYSLLILFLFLGILKVLWFSRYSKYERKRIMLRHLQRYSERLCRLLGIHISISGQANYPGPDTPTLILANHSSYLDIIILASLYPSLFVTSVERQEDWFTGSLSKVVGTLFIERRNKARLRVDLKQVADHIKAGLSMCLFPEGTTSDGLKILPFKSSLLAAIENEKIKILPVSLRYRKLNGHEINATNSHFVCWFGDMDFFPHLFELVKQQAIEVELKLTSTIEVKPGVHRKELCAKAREQIVAAFGD